MKLKKKNKANDYAAGMPKLSMIQNTSNMARASITAFLIQAA